VDEVWDYEVLEWGRISWGVLEKLAGRSRDA